MDATILLGAVAYDPKVVSIWEGIRQHFRDQGTPLDFVLFSNYEQQVESLLRGHVDIAWNTPLAHVRVKRRSQGRSLSLGMRDSDRDFHAKLIVRRDAGIQALSDLAGKLVAVGSRDSTQARILPLHFLKREGDDVAISRNAMEALQQYEWRGNVRELESVLKRAVLLARAERRTMLALKDLNEEVASTARRLVAIEEQILDSLREKKFSRSSVTETAEELGGLNRGTVAEYLRGECLRAFVECGYDLEKTARLVSLSAEPGTLERVTKRITEYLENLVESLDLSQPWEISRQALRPKTKNLPQRYHPSLEAVAEAYFRKVWTLKKPQSP